MTQYTPNWRASHHPARLWSPRPDGKVQCHLSPRNCIIGEGQAGFCRVRQNVGGELISLNYGRAIQVTEESIETEAVFHYAPGASILSLGNVGCMMNCDYCHNWKTSQARYLDAKDVHEYTPEEVVRIATERSIPVLSWTYNDPVVWHEFVLDTGRLAREHGLKNLFKSAFFISLEGAEELCEVIDIFSVSIKTMDEAWYRRITKGWLPPVLEATKYVFGQGKHVEISNLMVTDANDSEEDARRVADWVLTNLSDEVPIHFVRFHPDYKYTHVDRTPIERLTRARAAVLTMGVKYCYVGNVYGHEGANTYCPSCGHLLIERYGLNTWVRDLTAGGRCGRCDARQPFALPFPLSAGAEREADRFEGLIPRDLEERRLDWRGDVQACHVEITNRDPAPSTVYYWRLGPGRDGGTGPFGTPIGGGASHRFIVSKAAPDELGIRLQYPSSVQLRLYEVFDRAHFPTLEVEDARNASDRVPLPLFQAPAAVSATTAVP